MYGFIKFLHVSKWSKIEDTDPYQNAQEVPKIC